MRQITTAPFPVLLAALLWVWCTQAPAREIFSIGYVQRADDPLYAPHRAYTGLTLRDNRRPVDGAKTALRESRILGRALGLKFELVERTLVDGEDPVAVVNALAEDDGIAFVLLDLPIDDVIALAKSASPSVLFNVRHFDDALRGEMCSRTLFHTLPSHAMLMDALAQYLTKSKWRNVLILEGEEAADAVASAAFQRSARKFGLNVVDVRSFVLGKDPRVREQNNVRLLTGDADYDVIFLADSVGEFGRYVPYGTQKPRLVVGSEGLRSSTWHWTWERHGAPQLNQRFDKTAGRRMQMPDFAAWAAVKAIIEALVRTESTDIDQLTSFLRSDAFTLDIYTGVPSSFRAWDNQLRQSVLLHTHNAVIARAPLDGFLHRTNTLDTLGMDAPETVCSLDTGS